LRQLKTAGVDEVILAVGYMSQLFQAFFQNGEKYGLKIHYSFEEKALGTAGPISLVLDRLHNDFVIMNGDLLTTLNYANLFNFHREKKAAATIGIYKREVKIDFGVIETDAEGQLTRYIEKPTYQFDVSMGINVLNAQVIKPYLIPGEYLDIPTLMMRLRDDGHIVQCYSEPCYWLDIGRVDDYQAANEIFETNKAAFLYT
jgi:NDP-sugar pyrophosphorylase family protein